MTPGLERAGTPKLTGKSLLSAALACLPSWDYHHLEVRPPEASLLGTYTTCPSTGDLLTWLEGHGQLGLHFAY